MKLLHIDSSILGEASVSRQLSAAVRKRFVRTAPGLEVAYRDLALNPPPHLSLAHLAPLSDEADEALRSEVATGNEILEEFLAADTVIIGVALYNFSVSSQLKAWIDRIAVAGKTFRYTENGPEGLAGDKRVILTVARGGLYGPGAPSEGFEHAETYLRAVLGFIGITDPEIIVAEGLKVSEDHKAHSVKAALAQADGLEVAAAA